MLDLRMKSVATQFNAGGDAGAESPVAALHLASAASLALLEKPKKRRGGGVNDHVGGVGVGGNDNVLIAAHGSQGG
jgi:hypothetical protein